MAGRPSRDVFSENLSSWLIERKKTPADLARFLKVNRSLCSNWVNARSHPEQKHYDNIAAFLGIPVAALFKDLSDSRDTDVSSEAMEKRAKRALLKLAMRLMSENDLEK